jgi:hypothetical protein
MSLDPARDPRLDLFRGFALAIILVAHIPKNPWADAIPARFGPSDAAEIFVFCSGFASALAFGGTFRRHGFALGCLRIAQRCWQIYQAHLLLFLIVAALCVAGTAWPGGADYVRALWLQPFFAEPVLGLLGLVTLTYVPNYFDILPMYLVLLAMVPAAIALARVHPAFVVACSLGLYLAQARGGLDLPAEWWSTRPWLFNPFAWQLLFFTGFAFGARWLPAPPRSGTLLWLSLALVVALVPLSWQPLWSRGAWLGQASDLLAPWRDKTHLGILRYLHFLALSYLALRAVDRWPLVLRSRTGAALGAVGQQALPVFLWGLVLAQALGMALDQLGRGPLAVAALNGLGLASLVAVAKLAQLMKSEPWRQHRPRAGRPKPAATPGTGSMPRPLAARPAAGAWSLVAADGRTAWHG